MAGRWWRYSLVVGGVMALTAVTAWSWVHFGPATAATVVSLTVTILTMAASGVRWVRAGRQPALKSTADQLDRGLATLAGAVRAQWEDETAVRGAWLREPGS